MVLIALIVIVESPSIAKFLIPLLEHSMRPSKRALNSSMLFVFRGVGTPIFPLTIPLWYLTTQPIVEAHGFPFDTSSKFNFSQPSWGGVQIVLPLSLLFFPKNGGFFMPFHLNLILPSQVVKSLFKF